MIIPKTVALDTSQWVDLIRDANGSDLQLRREARKFPESLLEKGCSILFSFHHLQELLAYENDKKVADRLNFIKDIGFLSWIGPEISEYNLGSIVDIFAAEAKVAYNCGGNAAEVRQRCKELIIRSGSGSDLVVENPLFQTLLSEWAQGRRNSAKATVAISAFQFSKPGMTVGELKAGRLATDSEIDATMIQVCQNLSSEISLRGDKRITNASAIAADFVREVIEYRQTQPNTVAELVDAGFISQGIDQDEIQDHLNVDYLLDFGLFRSKLRIVAERTGISFEVLKRKVSREQLPHFLISNALKPIQDAQLERFGSNLPDRELACLAPYVDVLYVDKRTAEFFTQAIKKNPSLADIIGDVRKATSWRNVLSGL